MGNPRKDKPTDENTGKPPNAVQDAEKPEQEVQKAGRYRVFFRLYEKAIFKDVFVEVGVPESIVVSTAKDAIRDSLELIRYVPLEEPEGEPEEGEL
jgi:hypothetical protein